MAVTSTQEKSDEKEITVEYPKRSFKNIKATQNSVIKIKVRLNYGDSQVNRVEQIFLRLKHTEIGKTYAAYVSEYKSADDYYYINFDISDSYTMEAYNGLYELTLIVSDVGLDNPMIWNFGKLEINFRKALDPSNLSQSYKNIQKERMEPTFPVEESPTKNIVSSLVFSTLILLVVGYYLIYMVQIKANIENFPKRNKTAMAYSLQFVLVLLLITILLVAFFIKLNIIQTLLIVLAIGGPGSFIIFKALSHISIEV